MRKLKSGRKFGRKRDIRKAFLKSLASNLILKERIKTTESRAKELSSFAEKIISRARKKDLATTRHINRFLSKEAADKLVKNIAPKYKQRNGGYTRIVKIGPRKSDGASMVIIELV